MFRVASFFLILAIFQVARSEVPEHCKKLPPGINPEECCKLPKVFKDEDIDECGIDPERLRGLGGRDDCSKHICLLKKYNLMKDESSVDKSAVAELLDKWVETNTEFKDAVEKGKERCLKGDLPGPPGLCEPKKIGFCLMVTSFEECPTWKDSDNCKKFKEHIDECKSAFPF